MSSTTAPRSALILGGGGAVGVAWEIGLLAGLLDGGVDVRGAAITVGTSAGAAVGSQIVHGRDPREMLAALEAEAPQTAANGAERDLEAAGQAFGIWGGAERMTPERCAQVGAVALRAKTMSEADYLARFAQSGTADWPAAHLVITAVDCLSGELRAFDAASGVPLQLAVAASCAVPALFPSVTIEGRRYMDGGVRSGTSADLALAFRPESAVIIAPLGSGDRGIHPLCHRQALEEAAQLEAAGARVHVVHMDDASMAAGGANLMDYSARVPAAQAARAQGLSIAPRLQAIISRR
jgi:NTE family protein